MRRARAAVSLEAIAFQRATEGGEEIVIRGGAEVSRKRKPSDALLRMLLQASNPEKYGRTGHQATIQAREEIEARVKEIEEAAYRRAWVALVMEYNYMCEPKGLRVWFSRKWAQMHGNMCKLPYCRECHPERFDPKLPASMTQPDQDHGMIPGPSAWLNAVDQENEAERRRANAAGDYLKIDTSPMPMPTHDPDYVVPSPPPMALYPDPAVNPPAELLHSAFVYGPQQMSIDDGWVPLAGPGRLPEGEELEALQRQAFEQGMTRPEGWDDGEGGGDRGEEGDGADGGGES